MHKQPSTNTQSLSHTLIHVCVHVYVCACMCVCVCVCFIISILDLIVSLRYHYMLFSTAECQYSPCFFFKCHSHCNEYQHIYRRPSESLSHPFTAFRLVSLPVSISPFPSPTGLNRNLNTRNQLCRANVPRHH